MGSSKTRTKLAKKPPLTDIVHYNNISHHFRMMRYYQNNFSSVRKLSVCPLCRQEIMDKEEVYLIINNYKAFPNILVHTKCCDKQGKLNTVKILTRDYETALLYKLWFR